MAVYQDDYDLIQGDTFERQYTVTDSGGTAVNITSYTLACQFRIGFADDESVAATLTCTKIDSANGIFMVSLTAAQSLLLTEDVYYHDVQITNASGAVTTVAKGFVTMVRDVTR
jgi:hypothetical protein